MSGHLTMYAFKQAIDIDLQKAPPEEYVQCCELNNYVPFSVCWLVADRCKQSVFVLDHQDIKEGQFAHFHVLHSELNARMLLFQF